MAKKIDARLRAIVLREHRKNPYLGVRKLAQLIKEHRKKTISKSAVQAILKKKVGPAKRGRKADALQYKRREMEHCALLLLRCVDAHVGLFDCIAKELAVYFPRLKTQLVRKITILLTLSSYLGGDLAKNTKKSGFLRMADLYTFPSHKIVYFLKRAAEHKPTVNTTQARDDARVVSTIKFYFANRYAGHTDALLSTLWDGPCPVEHFFSTLKAARERIVRTLKGKVFMLNYTQSFNYLSPLVAKFIDGAKRGIKRVEFLSPEGKILERIDYDGICPYFFIGYYPRILAKGIDFVGKPQRAKKVVGLEGDIIYSSVSTIFAQAKEKKGVISNNVLLRRYKEAFPCWGIMTDIKKNVRFCLNNYLRLWPYMEKSFLEEIKIIEKYLFSQAEYTDLAELIPPSLTFEKEADFGQIGAILAMIAKERIGEVGSKAKGTLISGKGLSRLVIQGISPRIKKKFNKNSFSLNNKRIILP